DIEAGHKWYQTFLQKEADFLPHDGFVEWEIVPGCWLQVAEGEPASGSGPLRLAVKDLAAEKERLIDVLKVEDFEIFSREEVPVKRSEEHTSELQSRENLVCRLLLEKK